MLKFQLISFLALHISNPNKRETSRDKYLETEYSLKKNNKIFYKVLIVSSPSINLRVGVSLTLTQRADRGMIFWAQRILPIKCKFTLVIITYSDYKASIQTPAKGISTFSKFVLPFSAPLYGVKNIKDFQGTNACKTTFPSPVWR